MALYLGISVNFAAGAHFRQDFSRYIQRIKQGFIPPKLMYIVQHGAGGVGIIRKMHGASCKLPQQPCIHRAKEYLPPFGPFTDTLNVVQYPFYLAGRKVRIRYKAGSGAYMLAKALLQNPVNYICRAPALPYYGVVHRPSRVPIPKYGGLPLIGYAYARYISRRYAGLGYGLHHHAVLRCPYLHWVMLHPTLPGIQLGKLLLRYAYHILLMIKYYRPGACCALIQRKQILSRHLYSS